MFIGGITPNAIEGHMNCHHTVVLIQAPHSTNSEITHIVITSATSCFPLALCKHGCVFIITTLLLIVYIPLLIPPTDTPLVNNVVNK